MACMVLFFLYYYSQFFSTSKQFIFGVDAAPAALAGSALLSLGIVPGSEAALNYIRFGTFYWSVASFLLHYKSDRIVNFISTLLWADSSVESL